MSSPNWYFLNKNGLWKMVGRSDTAVEKVTAFPAKGAQRLVPANMVPGELFVEWEGADPVLIAPNEEPETPVEAHPRGVWIWQLDKLPRGYMERLKNSGCKRVYLKVFDDASRGNGFWSWQCTPAIVQAFNAAGIEVWGWGYHFDARIFIDTTAQVDALRQAAACGVAGYVVDVEQEVKDPITHTQLRVLLQGLQGVFPGKLGYTSFGAVHFHPEVPYLLLDEGCDFAFPQIYFEKFTFGRTDKQEIDECIAAHKTAGLRKPILPIFGSESDTVKPASAAELQAALDAYPGSSLWRAPNAGERGQAFNLVYGERKAMPTTPGTVTPAVPSDVATLRVTGPGKFHRGAWADLLEMELTIGDQKFLVASGARGAQFLRKPEHPASLPGSLEPIPQGRYTIGQIEWAGGKDNYDTNFSPQLGPIWNSLIAMFQDNRNSFGIHIDGNITFSPGSAGCVVLSGIPEAQRYVAAMRKFDPKFLDVDWNL